MRMSLGISCNNPLNIRYNNFNRWQGLKGINKGFCVFESMDYGLRAGIITLRTYINKHGLKSVSSILERFAPTTENNTCSYIRYVSSYILSCGGNPDSISFGHIDFCRMIVAMCMFESWYRCSELDIYSIFTKFKL